VRERAGGEMTATLLDASAGSRTRFLRELAGLARAGMQVRGRRTAATGSRRVLADALCLAAVWLMTLDLSTLLSQRVRGFEDPLLAPWSLVLLGVALALALVGYDRLAGATALVWTAARFPALLDHGPALVALVVTLPSVVCFATLAIAPRRRPTDPRRLAWLLVPATLVATFGPPDYDQSPLLLALVAIATLLTVVYALATLTTDPRIAIAGAIPLIILTAGSASPLAVISLVVLALALAATQRAVHKHRPRQIDPR